MGVTLKKQPPKDTLSIKTPGKLSVRNKTRPQRIAMRKPARSFKAHKNVFARLANEALPLPRPIFPSPTPCTAAARVASAHEGRDAVADDGLRDVAQLLAQRFPHLAGFVKLIAV